MSTNPFNARRLFEAQSREAYKRNGTKCICESSVTVLVKSKRRGNKRVDLGANGTVHLSSCPHSEMARTCWDEKNPKPRRKNGPKK